MRDRQGPLRIPLRGEGTGFQDKNKGGLLENLSVSLSVISPSVI
jgi:hypothetical protein